MRSGLLVAWCTTVGLACVGSPPPPPAHGDTESEATGGSSASSGPAMDPTTSDPTGLLDGSTTGSAASGSSGEPETTGVDGPLLVITDGPVYDFGLIAIGEQQSHLFAVSNEGSAAATGIAGLALDPPFSHAGEFPGGLGTCGSELAAGDVCLVEVLFSPTDLGSFAATLAIAYDGASAMRPMTGGGSGQSANLLVNPGGETQGMPPPGWSSVGAGTWAAEPPLLVTPFVGQACIQGETGPVGKDFVLRQDVPVEAWSATIDQGLLRFSFEGHSRSDNADNDPHRMDVAYVDAGGDTLASWTTENVSPGSWTLYTDVRFAPVGTRVVRVELRCWMISGNYCDAYFDELGLYALYP